LLFVAVYALIVLDRMLPAPYGTGP
jgi:hypothetical protein